MSSLSALKSGKDPIENKPVKNKNSNNRASNKRGNSIGQELQNDIKMCAEERELAEFLTDKKTYTVKEVVGHRVNENNELEYRVRWEGYCSDEDSWEPRKNFTNDEAIKKYVEKVKAAKKIVAKKTGISTNPMARSRLKSRFNSKTTLVELVSDPVLMGLIDQALEKRDKISESLKNALTKLRDFRASRLFERLELESIDKNPKPITYEDIKIEATLDAGQDCIKTKIDSDLDNDKSVNTLMIPELSEDEAKEYMDVLKALLQVNIEEREKQKQNRMLPKELEAINQYKAFMEKTIGEMKEGKIPLEKPKSIARVANLKLLRLKNGQNRLYAFVVYNDLQRTKEFIPLDKVEELAPRHLWNYYESHLVFEHYLRSRNELRALGNKNVIVSSSESEASEVEIVPKQAKSTRSSVKRRNLEAPSVKPHAYRLRSSARFAEPNKPITPSRGARKSVRTPSVPDQTKTKTARRESFAFMNETFMDEPGPSASKKTVRAPFALVNKMDEPGPSACRKSRSKPFDYMDDT